MVRFSWHVEDGLNAYLPPGAYTQHKESSVRHAACEIEVQNGKDTLEAIFTLPANYLDAQQIKETGIILGHGNNASEWKGKLLTDIAVHLAMQGFLVLRYCCRHKEGRRQRMFEKSLDACATSPFARGISQWVLAGMGSGARVAAAVGMQCRGQIAGYVLMSYPLKESLPTPTKGRRGDDEEDCTSLKSSEEPLRNLEQPILFLMGDSDKFCSLAEMRSTVATMSSPDIRLDLIEDANQDFKNSQNRGPAGSVMRRLCSDILDFVSALDDGNLRKCQISKASEILGVKDHASRAKTGEESARPDTLQDSPPRPSVQQFARMEATKQQAQLALQNAFGSSAELPDPASQPGRPGPANGNHPSAAGTAFAAPRASFPQPQVHNVNNGPHVPTTQQPGAGSATTAAATEPPPQLWHGPQQTRAPQPQASVPSSQLAPVAASAPAPRPGLSAALSGQAGSKPGPGQASNAPLPSLYQQISQQMLGGQMLPNPQQAQELLKALAAQRLNAQQQYQQTGSWSHLYAQQQPSQYQPPHILQAPAQSNPTRPNPSSSLQQMMMQHSNSQNRASHPAGGQASETAGRSEVSRPQAASGAQMLHTSNPTSLAQAALPDPQEEAIPMEQ